MMKVMIIVREHSIRTRIKTLVPTYDTVEPVLSGSIPLEQGLRHAMSFSDNSALPGQGAFH